MSEKLLFQRSIIAESGFTYWRRSHKADPSAAALADRHYSRRKPGSRQFMPPGQTVVLLGIHEHAVFGWWRPHPRSGITAMNGLDGWTCTIFRNEGSTLSSLLILDAERFLQILSLDCGPDGLLTYVEPKKLRSSNPGFCFLKAGWSRIGHSADHRKLLLQKVVVS
ncbi:MAG: hypothetical protein L0170_06965 [Acidobacteria bacterium]|nr:hypothetical protein [Acidobacteriota bacterium]